MLEELQIEVFKVNHHPFWPASKLLVHGHAKNFKLWQSRDGKCKLRTSVDELKEFVGQNQFACIELYIEELEGVYKFAEAPDPLSHVHNQIAIEFNNRAITENGCLELQRLVDYKHKVVLYNKTQSGLIEYDRPLPAASSTL